MPEYYTYKNIIASLMQEKAKNYIGKMVYFADNPNICLLYANTNDGIHRGILQEVKIDDGVLPFIIENLNTSWAFIIPCEEEQKPEYVPFEYISEFIDAYRRVEACKLKDENLFYLSIRGIWLKNKATDACCMVTEIWNEGIAVLDKKPTINGMSVYNNSTTWEGLLEDYTFIDGSPCGKIKEVSNE